MNKLFTLTILSVLLSVFAYSATAQNTCCATTTTAPEVTTGFYSTAQIGRTSMTPAPVLSVQATTDLPNTEYLITKRNRPAMTSAGVVDTTGGGGDIILGADADGIFRPADIARYGVNLYWGDTFDIIAVGYDLAALQLLTDSLLNGTNSSGTPCCDLFALAAGPAGKPEIKGFCDSMNNNGIHTAADVNGLNEILVIFDVFTEGELSVGAIISTLNLINSFGSIFPVECGAAGANNFLFYGINRSAKYGYDVEGTIAVQKLSDVSRFMVFPNPNTQGTATQVYFTTDQTVDLHINVINSVGTRVFQQTLGSVSGNINTEIPTQNLPAGLYIVELTDGHSSQTQQLIVR